MDEQAFAALSARYRRFADVEAAGRSPLYAALARRIAEDREVLGFLAGLPRDKRLPTLLFAAVRHCCGLQSAWPAFRRALLADADAVRAVMLARSTQTNEPGRCASLLPVLAQLPPPLALLEVGASAGLCLLPDHYGFDYGAGPVVGAAATAAMPVFACRTNAVTPLPRAVPEIVWRAGLDLNPLDVADVAQAAWLETLVWPEQTERLANLRAAAAIAAAAKPRVVRGDLRHDVAALAREAPRGATLVIFHTAVVAYVAAAHERQAFAAAVGGLCQCWIANEAPRVFPAIAAGVPPSAAPERFLLTVNGVPTAWSDPHGGALEWLA